MLDNNTDIWYIIIIHYGGGYLMISKVDKPVRSLTTTEIKAQLNHHFASIYRRFANYRGTSLWSICLEAVENPEIMASIVFCNDVLEIPPAQVFINLVDKGYISKPDSIDDNDKRFIGSFWGFVFKEVFAYTNQKQTRTGQRIIRNATYFTDNLELIKIVREVY